MAIQRVGSLGVTEYLGKDLIQWHKYPRTDGYWHMVLEYREKHKTELISATAEQGR
jgi:hypothetical protein